MPEFGTIIILVVKGNTYKSAIKAYCVLLKTYCQSGNTLKQIATCSCWFLDQQLFFVESPKTLLIILKIRRML